MAITEATHTVTFTDRGDHVEYVLAGEKVTKPAAPYFIGDSDCTQGYSYHFNGWYLNGKPYNFNSGVYSDIDLYPNWTVNCNWMGFYYVNEY